MKFVVAYIAAVEFDRAFTILRQSSCGTACTGGHGINLLSDALHTKFAELCLHGSCFNFSAVGGESPGQNSRHALAVTDGGNADTCVFTHGTLYLMPGHKVMLLRLSPSVIKIRTMTHSCLTV